MSSNHAVMNDSKENRTIPELPDSPKSSKKIHDSIKTDFVTKLAESIQTPKLTPRNTQNLTQLKIAPEMKNGKIPPPSPSATPRTPRNVLGKPEERPLLGPSQKIVIVPLGKSEGRAQVQVTVGSTSSDSSDGKGTPPRKRAMSSGKRRPDVVRPREPGVRMSPSLKSLRGPAELGKIRCNASWASFTFPDPSSTMGRPLSDVVSVRSLASIGMGSTDGKKLTIRRVPTSPTELLNIVEPKKLIDDDDLSSCTSYTGTLSDAGTHYRPRRDHWANKLQFILACVGYSVGLGNLWRFPYLCFKSGGGVFLVPYFLVLLLCGVPLLYMELAVGQFTRRGPIGALSQLCPMFKGAGLSSVVVSFFMSTYYSVIIAYFLYYFFTAFRANAPWTDCGNRWNTPQCWQPSLNTTRPNFSQSPSEEFYDRKVLQLSAGIDKPGTVRWEIAACLFLVWVIVYFALWKSVRSTGRVLYVTTTLPFVLVLAFLGRSLTLEGADYGLQYFFKPNWILLLDAKVWVNAVAQNFNSIGISFGSVISFASYNRYNNTILVDTVAVSLINAVTSLIVGIFAFATLGNIAREHDTDIEHVITDGPGLVFVLYPQAMARMPFSSFWAVLFFFMLLCLGLNSQFAIVEVVVTSLQDGFPNWIKRKLVCHEILVLAVCFVSFLLGLPNITQGGIYFFQLMDHYVVTTAVVYIAMFEVIAVCWLYGTDRLSRVIQHMTNQQPSLYFRFCWTVAAPLLILCVLIFSIVDYEPPTYNNGNYRYPWWAELLGWCVAGTCLLCIPITAVYVLSRVQGDTIGKKLIAAMTPRCDDLSEANSIEELGNELKEVKSIEPHAHSPLQPKTQPRIEIMKK
ncbi:sodium- and chloride-dependent GABA transporter ine-like [Macrosteles quadrilineatus]|uniref:sodium- and chloride-dependent GABA transporter ine-like n=1 Tax=Macrosteles quadrilineatus TaxID=74068 RepID=UPI0023E17756|nr:sodium- and chloride-dependent GABA transporter ine-like [Macrosteles quadrilineatus]